MRSILSMVPGCRASWRRACWMAWMVIFCYGAESWAPEGERGARGALRARGALLGDVCWGAVEGV